ncbi:biotin-dependent carboxyltransferase family protein [Acidothermaceae bacterium B102]|nr:biotin-dependent carboxyltransferase family protein [Acidothermaceae bacterium B102]
MTTLRVVSPGLQTTVQDLGRPGHARSGVPLAGALDPLALAAANAAVGNPAGAAGLECVLRGPTLVGDAAWTIAVAGAGWTLGPLPVASGVPYTVRVGPGLRCWVAVAGGIEVPPVLASRSTDTLSGFGGQVLRVDDVLPLGADTGRRAVVAAGPALPDGEVVLRLTAGPHADRLRTAIDGARFVVGARSDRTGLRLDGDPLAHAGGDIATIGVVPGAVQLPPDGRPIVLLGNCQTTGGYPVVGVVCAADLRLAVQVRPGSAVRLMMTGMVQARELSAQAAD